MGRFVDLNAPLSQEDRDYLISRGRGYLLAANERRFGTPDEPREPEDHESVVGSPAQSPFYQSEDRAAAVYDKGGAPLPGATLDYDTGRAFDRDNGVTTLEFNPMSHMAGAHPSPYSGFDESSEYDDDIDDDIVDKVMGMNVSELEAELKEAGKTLPEKQKAGHLNVDELKEELQQEEVAIQGDYKKADLVKALSDKYEKNYGQRLQDELAVYLQDERKQEHSDEPEQDSDPDFAESDDPA